MFILLVPLGSIILLYLTRRAMTKQLGLLVYRLGGDKRAFTLIWSIIFLPGTIVHEMSHFFAAAFTGTRTGKIEIFPDITKLTKLHENHEVRSARLGSVQTQELGLVRGFIVGTAPLFIGLALLIWLSSVLRSPLYALRPIDLATLYLFFTIANSLFLSWTDFKHALPLIAVVIIGVGLLYLAGLRPAVTLNSSIINWLTQLRTALLVSVGINIAVLLFLLGINRLIAK